MTEDTEVVAENGRRMNRGRKIALLVFQVLFNFLLPWALYRLSVPRVGETNAIVVSALAPAVWSVVQFARSRQVDVWSAIVLAGLALSLVALSLGGSPKLLLFRQSLITGLVGLVLVGSAIVRRPLMYAMLTPVVRAFASERSAMGGAFPSTVLARASAELESFAGEPWFRRVMTVMTVVVGLVLVAETVAAGILIFTLPTERVLLLGPLVRYGAVGVLLLWTFLYFVPTVRRHAQS